MQEIRAAHAHAIQVKLEPTFGDTTAPVELPDLASMPAQWSRYLEGQDLTGFDRRRLAELGQDYLTRAVEVS
jgi:hypothetical protein